MVFVRSRLIVPALAGLLSLTLTAPALADAPAIPDQTFLASLAAAPEAAPEAALEAPATVDAALATETLAAETLAAVAAPAAPSADAAAAPAPVVETLAVPAAPIVAPALPAPAFPAVSDLRVEDLEAALLARVNADRAVYGLAPLAADPDLLGAARTRAAAQIGAPSLSHYDANGKIAIQGLLNGGNFTYSLAGENLARLRPEDSSAVAQATDEAAVALMNSPLHRKNILEPRFTKLAIGAVRGPDGKLIYAQIFRAA